MASDILHVKLLAILSNFSISLSLWGDQVENNSLGCTIAFHSVSEVVLSLALNVLNIHVQHFLALEQILSICVPSTLAFFAESRGYHT